MTDVYHDLFWVVWNPYGENPQTRHSSMLAAQKEAIRLSEKQPDTKFYVLQANGHAEKITPRTFEWYV